MVAMALRHVDGDGWDKQNAGLRVLVVLRQQPLVVGVWAADLLANYRNAGCASRMKAVAARTAVEALEEEPPAAFAKGQREESLADEVVGYAGRYGEAVDDVDADLLHLECGHVFVPVDHLLGAIHGVDDAHFRFEVAQSERFVQGRP